MERVNYLLDTNVFHSVGLKEFMLNKTNCGIIIPMFVLEELENQKTCEGVKGYKARKAIRELYDIKKYGNLSSWIKLDKNISIKTEKNFDSELQLMYDKTDDLIIGCLSYCNRVYGKTIMATDDIVMALKSEELGLQTEQNEEKDDLYKNVYKGYEEIPVNDKVLSAFYERGYLYPSEIPLIPYQNQIIVLTSETDEKRKAIGVYCYDRLEKCKYLDSTPSKIKPRSLEQKMAIELLMRDDIPVVSLTGAYGTSKTFLQLGVALEKLNTKNFNKILLVKPSIPLDKNLAQGFLPGSKDEKSMPVLGSITSNLEALKEDKKDKFMTGSRLLEGYLSQGVMEIVSLENILGSSYNNSIVIAEEMQLLTKENMEALLSRIGNSRLFINGDLKQSSRTITKDPREMGLFHFINTFKDSKYVAHLKLENIQRSEFVKELYEKW